VRHIKQFNESADQGFTEVGLEDYEKFIKSGVSVMGTITVEEVKKIVYGFQSTIDCIVFLSTYKDLEDTSKRILSLNIKPVSLERLLSHPYKLSVGVQLLINHRGGSLVILKDSDDWWWVKVSYGGSSPTRYKCDQLEGVISLLSHLGLIGA
jgi:hypothetical protein